MKLPLIVCGALGRMGRAVVSEVARRETCTIRAGIARSVVNDAGDKAWDFPFYDGLEAALREHKNAVIIDFSTAKAGRENIAAALRHRAPLLIATTGHDADTIAFAGTASRDIPIVIAPNTSLMANLLIALCGIASTCLGEFHASILDVHHAQKKDAPSGTALKMAAAMRSGNSHRDIEIHSMRKGSVAGEHTAYFFHENDRLELTHRVTDRKIFAEGALVAAQFLFGRRPGLYDMNDVLNLNLTIEK